MLGGGSQGRLKSGSQGRLKRERGRETGVGSFNARVLEILTGLQGFLAGRKLWNGCCLLGPCGAVIIGQLLLAGRKQFVISPCGPQAMRNPLVHLRFLLRSSPFLQIVILQLTDTTQQTKCMHESQTKRNKNEKIKKEKGTKT